MKKEVIDFLGLTSEGFNTITNLELLKPFFLCSALVSIDGSRYAQIENLGKLSLHMGLNYIRLLQWFDLVFLGMLNNYTFLTVRNILVQNGVYCPK